jgi:hypothetical protein
LRYYNVIECLREVGALLKSRGLEGSMLIG